MKIGKIDFFEAISKYWNHPDQFKGTLTVFALQLLFVIPIMGMFAVVMIGPSLEDSEPNSIAMLILGCFYCMVWILILLANLFMPGTAISTYKQLQNEGKFDVAPLSNIGEKLVNGLKYVLVSFVYTIPFIVLISVFIVVLIAFISSVSGSGSNFDDYAAMVMLLVMCLYFVAIAIAIVFQMVWQYVFTPIIYKLIAENRFGDALNPMSLWSEVQANKSDLLALGLSWFLINFAWGIVYFVVYILCYLLIGFIFLPFVVLGIMIIKMYIQPYYMYMAFKKIKEA